ncbi:selenocysteine-specific translation elongation factor [Knoellia sp. CPCC 206435]|uniref:selenocysteine-specific translation elongation factor n=1 Tax=Knoellia terrae TaxID=3404797 RepID=UPI003B435EFE
MRWVLATAGHVDHGKSTLVRALTGRDPDRLGEERARGLTIELGFAWTTLPGGNEVAFVDVPGHQRFVGTMLAGLGPTPAVVFVVAADQGWQAQSTEHLAAVRALGIRDGVLVLTRCDLAEEHRQEEVAAEASRRLREAGLDVDTVRVSATTGAGLDGLVTALEQLTQRLPAPDDDGPVRLWTDRSFSIAGAGTVVTGTLGSGTLRVGDHLTLLDHGRARDVTVRGLHSQDLPHEHVGPVSRVAVNLRRVESGMLTRSAVLVTPGSFALGPVVDVELAEVGPDEDAPWSSARAAARSVPPPPRSAVLHVGSADAAVGVRPLGAHHARLTADHALPWRVGDRAILRDPGSRRLWAVRVLDVEPLPLRRRGAAAQRGRELESDRTPADVRLVGRGGDHPVLLRRLGLPDPVEGVRVGEWWFDASVLAEWSTRLREAVEAHHAASPLSAGLTTAEALHRLRLPDHLRAVEDGGTVAAGLSAPGAELLRRVAGSAGLVVQEGRVRATGVDALDLGPAERAVVQVETALREAPFDAPDRDRLCELGLGPRELAAAQRTGRLLRLDDDVVLLPDGPARAMRVLSSLGQPFTLSAARQALGTTRRVAVPLLEHLDARGWTRRLDGQLRTVVR